MDKKFKKNFLKSSVSTSIGQFATIVFHFFSIIIVARNISKDDLGIYLLIFVVNELLQKLSGFGLELTLVKFLTNKQTRKEAYFPIFVIRIISLLLFSLVFFLAGRLILEFLQKEIVDYINLIILLFCIGSIRELGFNLLQGLNYFKKYAIAQVISALIKVSLIFTLILSYKLTIISLVLVDIVAYAMTIVLQFVFVPFSEISIYKFGRQKIYEIFRFGFPLYFNDVLTIVTNRFNVFIIAYYLTPANIANYEVANKVPQALLRMFKSFIVVYFPNLSSLFSEKKYGDAEKLMNQSISYFTISSVLILMVSFVFKEEIITLLFSDSYLIASLAFALLILNFNLKMVSNLMGYSLVAAGYSSAPAKINSISIVVNLVSALILIPRYSFIGAVYALITMNTVSIFVTYYFMHKHKVNINVGTFLKPLFVFGLFASIFLLLSISNIILKILFLAGYLLLSGLILKDFRNLVLLISKRVNFLNR